MQKNFQSPSFGGLALAITAGAIATQPILFGLILPTHANWDFPNSAGLPAIGPGTVSSSDRPEQQLIEAESKIENEALKVPDSKVLQDDLNSL